MNEEILKKLAGGGKSPEEVLAIAKNGELTDEELDQVAGGGFKEDRIKFLEENCWCCCHFRNDCHCDMFEHVKNYGFTPCPDKA